MRSNEPRIHSHIDDVLEKEHPLSEKQVHCKKCKVLVHAFNNECMQTWIETGSGNYCLKCFANIESHVVMNHKFALQDYEILNKKEKL